MMRGVERGRIPFGRTELLGALLATAAMMHATSAAACDPALEAAVAARPELSDERDALARSCARAGRTAEALAHYEVLLRVDGGNPDWLLGQSQALLALGRAREALPSLERGRAVAPAYEDIWRVYVTALEAAGEPERAMALAAEAERAFPAATWPRERQVALERARLLERGSRLSLGASYEDLSGGRPSWKSVNAQFERPLAGTRRLLAALNLEERFDTQDEQLSIGVVDRIGRNWSWGVSADAAQNAEILPDWSVVAEVGRMLPGNRSIGLRARHAEYETVDVDSLAATIEQYAARFRIAYTLTGTRPTDIDWSFGHGLRLAHDYEYGSHVTLALAYGEEAETVAPGVVQVTDVRAVVLHGVHWQSPAWGIAWEAGWHEQGDLYDRIRIRLGLEHRF